MLVGAMIFGLAGDDVADSTVVGCRAGIAGGVFLEGDPGNDPALLPNGVTTILDLDVETLGPLSVGVLIRSGDSTVLSSGGFALNDIGIVERSRFGGFFRGGGFWRTGGGCFGSGGAVLAMTLSLI